PPWEWGPLGREELQPYGIDLREVAVTSACAIDGGFRATLAARDEVSSRKLLIATGVVDRVPRGGGIDACYGRSVFHCPYCDAWELRDRPLAAYGRRRHGVGLSVS